MRRVVAGVSGLLPSAVLRNVSSVRLSGLEAKKPIVIEDIKITTLLPDNQDHYKTFVRIITDKDVIFTSPWMNKWFGLNDVKEYRDDFELRLKLAAKGYPDLKMLTEDLEAYKADNSRASQLALDRFFSKGKNEESLVRIYKDITHDAKDTDLGYYKLEDGEKKLLGGGALVPIEGKDHHVEKVDLAVHILERNRGVGTTCLDFLLNKAFDECGVKEVHGSSIMEKVRIPTLCSRHGMIMKINRDGELRSFLDSDMWKATRGKKEKVAEDPIVAATYYAKLIHDKGSSKQGGR